MIKNVKAPVGDFRDWDAITAWATSTSRIEVFNNVEGPNRHPNSLPCLGHLHVGIVFHTGREI